MPVMTSGDLIGSSRIAGAAASSAARRRRLASARPTSQCSAARPRGESSASSWQARSKAASGRAMSSRSAGVTPRRSASCSARPAGRQRHSVFAADMTARCFKTCKAVANTCPRLACVAFASAAGGETCRGFPGPNHAKPLEHPARAGGRLAPAGCGLVNGPGHCRGDRGGRAVDRHRNDDDAVVLGADLRERLQPAQFERGGVARNDLAPPRRV